jgi:hypothetical protein
MAVVRNTALTTLASQRLSRLLSACLKRLSRVTRLNGQRDAAALAHQLELVHGVVREVVLERLIVFEVQVLLALAHAVERWLRDEQMPLLDELVHLSVEEREQQGTDVRAVHVGVRHDDDGVVAELVEVDPAGTVYAAAQGGDQRANLRRAQHALEPRTLDVEDFATQRQDGLVPSIAAHLGASTRAVSLDDVQLRSRRILGLAVGQLAG